LQPSVDLRPHRNPLTSARLQTRVRAGVMHASARCKKLVTAEDKRRQKSETKPWYG
jgi:hypothetical protein